MAEGSKWAQLYICIYQYAVRHRIKIKTEIRISKLNLISGPMVDFYLNYALKDRRLRFFLKSPPHTNYSATLLLFLCKMDCLNATALGLPK